MPTRIFIADDHESVLRRVRAALEAQPGWEVCGDAVDGREAVTKIAQLKPDVVILDFAMPRMDGLKTASQIKQLLPEVPIVMFSMYAAQLREEVQKHDVSLLIDKTESGGLVAAIQKLLGAEKGEVRAAPPATTIALRDPALEADKVGQPVDIKKAS